MPAVRPVTIPVDDPMAAMLLFALLHAPYWVAFESVAEDPSHMVVDPMIAAGAMFTVTIASEVHPLKV